MKAQTTVEYIVIISIILVLAGLALGFISGSLDPNIAKQRSSLKYWETADIGIVSHQHEGSIFRMLVQNNLDHDISIKKITLTNSYDTKEINVGSVTLATSETYAFNLTHAHDATRLGRNYEYDVIFTYTNPVTGSTYTFLGQAPIIGRVQTQTS